MEAASSEGYLVIPPYQVEAACTEGFDGMSELVARVPLDPNPNANPNPNLNPNLNPNANPNANIRPGST